MTLNNNKSVINLKIVRRASIILYLAFLILAFAARVIKFPLLGMSQAVWVIFATVVFLTIVLVPAIFNYQYIYFSDEGNSIVFRYYTAGFIEGKKNSVEIGKKTFSGYTLDSRFLGLVQSIVLYQRFKEGIAKYPPIYISALKKKDKKAILDTLHTYAPRVRGKGRKKD